jgi:hypothetical protein
VNGRETDERIVGQAVERGGTHGTGWEGIGVYPIPDPCSRLDLQKESRADRRGMQGTNWECSPHPDIQTHIRIDNRADRKSRDAVYQPARLILTGRLASEPTQNADAQYHCGLGLGHKVSDF